jgi:transcription elongation factor GreA
VICLVGEKENETYKIVGTTEADILAAEPKISNESPIGKALIGKKK